MFNNYYDICFITAVGFNRQKKIEATGKKV